MGCFGSREDARRKVFADDWTTTEFAFSVGSIKSVQGFSPLDKIVASYCGGTGKELKDGIGELTDLKLAEEEAKKIGEAIWTALKEFHKLLEKSKDGTKDGEVFGKYTGKEAFDQIEACLKAYAEKSGLGYAWPEAAPAEKPEGMEDAAEGEKPAEGEAAEGGEEAPAEGEGEKKEEAAAEEGKKEKVSLIAADAFGEATGPAELPKLLLSLMFYHPVFGDAVKSQTMHWELGGDSDKEKSFGPVAAVVGAYVTSSEKADAASFGAAWLDQNDIDELKEAKDAATDRALVFPGIVGAWADEADALGQATEVKGKTQVLFKFQGKVLKPAGDKLHVFSRQFAKVESFEDPAEGKNYHVCTLSDYTEHAYATVAEWAAAVEAATKVVEEVKDAAEKKDDAKEGEEEKKDDAPMENAEGEGM